MKAETINVQLEAQKIHGQFGTTEMANYKIQKLCEAYAKLQIEKDRERVFDVYQSDTTWNEFKHIIETVPIILD